MNTVSTFDGLSLVAARTGSVGRFQRRRGKWLPVKGEVGGVWRGRVLVYTIGVHCKRYSIRHTHAGVFCRLGRLCGADHDPETGVVVFNACA